MANRDEENIELESQPLNAEKKAEIFASTKNEPKEKKSPIGLTKEELMKYAKDPFWCRLRKILFIAFWALWLFMFVGAFLIIHYYPSCPTTSRLKWYQKESTAQIDMKLFDNKLANISKHIDTFQNVFQTKTFLLPNLFNSTSSNDITNHMEINPKYGDQAELSKLIKDLKTKQETSVIMDLNAATTSRVHSWFKKFENGDVQYTNYYLTADPEYKDYVGFETEKILDGRLLITKGGKPCLNLLNSGVREEFRLIFDKWGRLNVKGFRLLGAPFLVADTETSKVSKHLQLNQKLIKEWSKELKHAVSDGALILQLDDQDAEDYQSYFGTQNDPIADIVVNKFISRLDVKLNSTSDIKSKLQSYINSTRQWNDELMNIGPWTGWLIDDLNESRTKDDLVVCFGNILGYTLPRGMPVTRISFNLLHIGLGEPFFNALKESNFNNLEQGTYNNARVFAKLAALRKQFADPIMLGRTEFVNARISRTNELTDDVFTMIRSNNKQGLIVIANLKNGSKKIRLDIDFNRFPRVGQIAASCKIKEEDHQFGTTINLDQTFELKINETLVATFDMIN